MICILKYVRNYIFNVHVWHFLVYLKISLLKINNVLWNHILLKAKHAKKNKHPKKRDVFLLLIAEYWPWTCEDDERDLILNFITEHSGFSELNRDNRWYLFRTWKIRIWHTKINVAGQQIRGTVAFLRNKYEVCDLREKDNVMYVHKNIFYKHLWYRRI